MKKNRKKIKCLSKDDLYVFINIKLGVIEFRFKANIISKPQYYAELDAFFKQYGIILMTRCIFSESQDGHYMCNNDSSFIKRKDMVYFLGYNNFFKREHWLRKDIFHITKIENKYLSPEGVNAKNKIIAITTPNKWAEKMINGYDRSIQKRLERFKSLKNTRRILKDANK